MNRKIILFLLTVIIIITTISNVNATDSYSNSSIYNNTIPDFFNNMHENYTKTSNNISLFSFNDNTSTDNTENNSNESDKFNKTRPIYFAMDHTNAKDEEIFNTVIDRLESEGFNVVKAEIGPNKMSQNTHYLYEHNISDAIVFHLFNGVDPSTIRELAVEGNDNRGKVVRQRGNDVVLAWFYDSVDCVNENASGTKYVYGSETGAGLENPRQYMEENNITAICTSSDMGKHKQDADYTGQKTVEEFIKLFSE